MQPEKDSEISFEICKKLNLKYVFIDDILKYDRLLGILKNAEFCVAMRLHTLIYAAKTITPSIGIVYDPKVSSMLNYTNQKCIIDLSDVSAKSLMENAEEILKNKNEIRLSLEEKTTELTALAKENAVIVKDLLK